MPKSKKKADDGDRLLTLAELAKYLHLSQKTVLKLAASNRLPGVLLEEQWRFKRAAVDEWLEHQQFNHEHGELEDVPDGMQVPLGDLLPDEAIIADMRAPDALGAIEELAARAYSNRWLTDKPWFIGAVVERESLSSTAMEGGVAFLHTRARDKGKIAQPFVICGRSYQGIDFGAPDGKPTYLFFLLGLKYDKLHLPILGRLARAMRDARTIGKLRSLPLTSKMRALLLKEDQSARTQTRTGPVKYRKQEPQLDRQQRLRQIMRREAIRKHEEKKSATPTPATRKRASAAKKKTTAAAKAAAAEAAATKAAVARSAAAGRSSKTKAASTTKKSAASAKKKASSATKKSAASAKKKASSATKKSAASAKKKASSAKKK